MKSILVVFTAVLASGWGCPATSDDVSAWQERRLLAPTAQELEQEKSGQFFIYDGLSLPLVERGLDDGFERIENMMFIRTRLPPTTAGETETIDDDCD